METLPGAESANPIGRGSHLSLKGGEAFQFGTGSPGRTIRMKWSTKVECISGTSDLGIWQLTQFAVAFGQILGVAARAPPEAPCGAPFPGL